MSISLRPALWLFVIMVWMCAASSGSAQEYPNKLIRFVVPTAPGTIQDILSRLIGPEMSKLLGQPVLVENKPGADFVIGYEHVAKQVPADGYTIAAVNVATLAALPVTVKELRFD